MALLDAVCTKTGCGEMWLQHYLQSLSYDEYKHVEHFPSSNMFKFGDSEIIKSAKSNF